MSRGFTTNDPNAVPVARIVTTMPATESSEVVALRASLHERDVALDELREELGKLRAENARWIAYNDRLALKIERVRELIK